MSCRNNSSFLSLFLPLAPWGRGQGEGNTPQLGGDFFNLEVEKGYLEALGGEGTSKLFHCK